ncbi:MAG: 50S ribosomal protein L9, partial [Bacteroidota bacterium]
MKVILRKEHEKLGNIGDVVDVKDGYARNYLFPRNIAFPATKGAVAVLEEEKKQAERSLSKELKSSEKIAAELEKVSITILMKVGE